MSRVCAVCGKGQMTGHKVSHSNIKTNRTFKPNVHKVTFINKNGKVVTEYVCTRCLRKVERYVKAPKAAKNAEEKIAAFAEPVDKIVEDEVLTETAETEETEKETEEEKKEEDTPIDDLV